MKRVGYGLVFLAAGVGAFAVAGFGVWQVWFFAIAPDLTFAIAGGSGLQRGQIHPRAVPFYNAAHNLGGPVLMAAAAVILTGRSPWLAGSLAWLAHIAADRALGFGPRTSTGFIRDALA